MFSSKSFIVSGLISRSLIHFEFIFLYGVRKCSNFILFHVAVQFSQHHLLNKFFSIVYSYLICHRLIDCRCMGLILGFLSCSTDLYFSLYVSAIWFWWLLLCTIYSLKSGSLIAPAPFFFFRMSLVILGLLCF